MAIPKIFVRSKAAVSDGVRSSDTNTLGSSRKAVPDAVVPERHLCNLREISRKSTARSRKYLSSSWSKKDRYFPVTRWTHFSTFSPDSLISFFTSSIKARSSSTNICASKIPASFSPRFLATSSRISRISDLVISKASRKRLISSAWSDSSTSYVAIFTSSCRKRNTGP